MPEETGLKEKQVKNFLMNHYSRQTIQELYKKVYTWEGLWKGEALLIDKYYAKNSSVLDIGCGSGRTTFPLAKKGFKVVGVDLVPEMIKTAKELAKSFDMAIDFQVGDATNLHFNENSFDNALFSFCGWNQIPGRENRLKALKEINRVLKPGGYFIFASKMLIIGRPSWNYYWAKQWVKMKLLNRFGLKTRELEFGDMYWTWDDKKMGKVIGEQYMFVSSFPDLEKQLSEAGFKLILKGSRRQIEADVTKNRKTTLFVCQKSKSNRKPFI